MFGGLLRGPTCWTWERGPRDWLVRSGPGGCQVWPVGPGSLKRDGIEVDMRQVRGSMLVVVLCCAARTAVAEERPDARLQEAQTAFDEANKLWDAGQRADAIARGEHALALRESVLGSTHPDVATCLDWLGLHFLFQKNPVRGEPLLQRALAIREAAYGRDSSSVGRALNDLADRSSAQGFVRPGQAALHARARHSGSDSRQEPSSRR